MNQTPLMTGTLSVQERDHQARPWNTIASGTMTGSPAFGRLQRGGLAKRDPQFRRFRFHDLRHLHAVQWLQSGRSIYSLQQRLGHTSL
jgi:integrase